MHRELVFKIAPVRIDGVEYYRGLFAGDCNCNIFSIIPVKIHQRRIIRKLLEDSNGVLVNDDPFTDTFGVLNLMKPKHELISSARLPTH